MISQVPKIKREPENTQGLGPENKGVWFSSKANISIANNNDCASFFFTVIWIGRLTMALTWVTHAIYLRSFVAMIKWGAFMFAVRDTAYCNA